MRKVFTAVKALILLTALLFVAWSALPGSAEAGAFCEGAGHTCHAVIGGTTHHLEESPPSY